jgi:hypothetical protein
MMALLDGTQSLKRVVRRLPPHSLEKKNSSCLGLTGPQAVCHSV